MNVVGPRPITAAEVARYGHHFDDYCSIRPGVIGLWQVSGRSNLSYAERVRLDVHYAHHRSLLLDLKILLLTGPAVLARRGSH